MKTMKESTLINLNIVKADFSPKIAPPPIFTSVAQSCFNGRIKINKPRFFVIPQCSRVRIEFRNQLKMSPYITSSLTFWVNITFIGIDNIIDCKKRVSPKTEFWGTPALMAFSGQVIQLRTTQNRVLLRNEELTHFFPMHPFSTPWKHQKTLRFSDVFRG